MTEPQRSCRIASIMKRLFMVSAMALLLAGCDTMLPGQSYPSGQPYPPAYPGDAYPPAPYPPGPGYPAPNPYQPGPPAPAACPITSSRDWAAWLNAMPGPGTQPKLIVTGKVVTATGGYQIAFDPRLQVTKNYPAEAFATLNVIPPSGAATPAIVTQNVRWEWPLNLQIGSVEIRCGDETLAHIEPVATAQ
jgi:hypothetical protein